MEIINADVLEHLKRQGDCSWHTLFSDFPYGTGNVWEYIEKVLQLKGQGRDFMGAWDFNNVNWWREYLSHVYRTCKYGGYVVMYSISQQSWAFSALMVEAGFEKCQELHWANISNFPKASDASKAVDRKVGAEREVVGKKKMHADNKNGSSLKPTKKYEIENGETVFNITAPATELAELLNGYKYGKAPLKKNTDTILVFRKSPKNGSVLNDLMQCQSDPEISPAILDIERNRVYHNDELKLTNRKGNLADGLNKGNAYGVFNVSNQKLASANPSGRYPCTLFISPAAAELLDSQLDVITYELNGKIYTEKRLEMVQRVSLAVQNNALQNFKELHGKREVMKASEGLKNINGDAKFWSGKKPEPNKMSGFSDSGYISRVMHQPDFTQDDYDSLMSAYNAYSFGINEDTFYFPTVSPKERNAGCESLLYKGIQNIFVLKTNPKTQKQSRSKYDFDMIVDYEINPNANKSKDIETAFVKLFYDLVCETSEADITDTNFVELAILAKDYENEIGGFFYLGNDLFKVFAGAKEYVLEVKNVIRNGNGHPTLKPINLNRHIFGLFLLPKVFNQVVYVPFSGSGSEVIAVRELGVENIISVEQNPDYIEIQKHRLNYYANLQNIHLPKDVQIETTKPKLQETLF